MCYLGCVDETPNFPHLDLAQGPTEELLEMASTIDERERRQITTEAEATDGSNSSRYYHTRLRRNPSSRVNYNER